MGEGVIGIIGGSGLYQMEGIEEVREEAVRTPFGDPSDRYILGRLQGRPVAFLGVVAAATSAFGRDDQRNAERAVSELIRKS